MSILRRAAVVVAGCALAVAVPTGDASATGKLGHMFTYTYYATADHSGQPIGGYVYGYCPSYFSSSWGTRSTYSTLTIDDC